MATYTKTVDPNGGSNYASLNAWEAGEQTLYASGDIAVADCKRTGATKDTTAVTIAGWTAGVVPKIIVNAAHRHEGKWANQRSDNNYIYIIAINATWTYSVAVGVANSLIDGLLIDLGGKEALSGINLNNTSSGSLAINNIIANGGISSPIGIMFGDYTNGAKAANNIVKNVGYGIRLTNLAQPAFLYNNTIYGSLSDGIRHNGSATTQLTAINNAVFATTGVCFGGGFKSTSDYNVSSDATAPGTNKATGKTAYTDYFVDPAAGDFHLKASALTLWGLSGADLSGTFTTDIDGQTRSGAWDIGADQYVSAGGPTTYTQTCTGSFSAPSGALAQQVSFVEALSGSFPSPSGTASKLIGKNIAGALSAPSGATIKQTAVTRTGSMPAPSGSLQESVTFHQAVAGIMGSIAAIIATVLNPIIPATKNKIKIIGSAFRKLIGG